MTEERVGVDFGGTRIKAGTVVDGSVIRAEKIDTPATAGPSAVLDAVAEVVKRLGPVPSEIGVAIPGEVDDAGRCYRLPNVPGFDGVNIAEEVSKRLGCRVHVENDSSSAALGELLFGHGQRHRSFLLATLGTGVGGGLVVDGKFRRGAHGFAGEIGHLRVSSAADAWPCVCGLRGCMEVYAGTRGLLRHYQELGGVAAEPVEVARAAEHGDAAALEAFRRMGEALGVALAQAQKVIDLDALIFGGGISASFPLIEPALRQALRAHAFGPPTAEVPLLVSQLGVHAGVIGAAHLG